MKQILTCMLMGALLAALVSCGQATTPNQPAATSASPAPASPRAPGQFTSGTIAGVEGNTLTLTTAQGQVAVNIGPNTSIQKTVAGTLADLKEGQSLTVTGPQNADGVIVATSISIRSPGPSPSRTRPAGTASRPSRTPATPSGGAPRATSGTITNIVSNTLTLNTAQGQVTVNLASNTSILKTVSGTLADLQEGESLAVTGARDANGNIAATSVIVRPPGQNRPSGTS